MMSTDINKFIVATHAQLIQILHKITVKAMKLYDIFVQRWFPKHCKSATNLAIVYKTR